MNKSIVCNTESQYQRDYFFDEDAGGWFAGSLGTQS